MPTRRYLLCQGRMTYYDETFHLGSVFGALLGRFSRDADRELRPQCAGSVFRITLRPVETKKTTGHKKKEQLP